MTAGRRFTSYFQTDQVEPTDKIGKRKHSLFGFARRPYSAALAGIATELQQVTYALK